MSKAALLFSRAAMAAGGLLIAMLPVGKAWAVIPEVVTINSSGAVFTPPARLDSVAAAAIGNVILLSGGNGLTSIDASGFLQNSQGNFLNRSANEFMLRGMNVMLTDVAPALPSGITYAQRLNGTHKAMIQTFVNAANTRWPGKPTWIIGTSNGSVSIVGALGDVNPVTGVAGAVLTSPVTVITNSLGQIDTPNQAVFDADKVRINTPSLVVWHVNDGCFVSPPSGAQSLFNSIPAATKSTIVVTGGHSVVTELCGGASWHGYAGVEANAIAPIVSYIRAVSGFSGYCSGTGSGCQSAAAAASIFAGAPAR